MSTSSPLSSFNDWIMSIFWTFVILSIILELIVVFYPLVYKEIQLLLTPIYVCCSMLPFIFDCSWVCDQYGISLFTYQGEITTPHCLSFTDFTMFNSGGFVQTYTTHIYTCPIYSGHVNAQIAQRINRVQLTSRMLSETIANGRSSWPSRTSHATSDMLDSNVKQVLPASPGEVSTFSRYTPPYHIT